MEHYSNLFDSRDIILKRYINISSLELINFPYLGILRDFGWWDFISLHKDAYIDVVRVFYSNANNTFNGRKLDIRFRTNACGRSFEVNTSLIHNLFGIPKGGEGYQSWTFNFTEATQVVFEDKTLTRCIDNTFRLHL